MTLRVGPYLGAIAEWDDFAARQPGFTHFHRLGWSTLMADAFGHECLYLAAWNEVGGLEGVLPLVRVKSILFGHYLMSMPFLNYGGPLGSPEAVQALAGAAAAEADRSGVKLLELRSRIPLPLDWPVSRRKITVVLDLPPAHDALMKSFDSKLRSQVRRPAKEGVSVRFGSDQVPAFFEVFSRHMLHLGTPTLPLKFFEAIARVFPDDAWFGCAWLGNAPIACGAGFRWGGEFEMTWASSLIEHNRIAPNMLVYWAFMERAIREGVRLFNFGRCTPDSGTHRFKRQWGSRDEQLWWYQVSNSGAPDAATPSPDQGKYRWGPILWKRLPLPVSRWLGPHIVRSIP